MEKRKIIIDREVADSNEIKSHMDFDRLMKKHTVTSKYQPLTKKIIIGTVAVITFAALIITGVSLWKKPVEPLTVLQNTKEEQLTTKPSIKTELNVLVKDTPNISLTNLSSPVTSYNHHTYANRYNSLDEYYRTRTLKLQLFTIVPTRDTTIIGEQGTKLIIRANSFVDQEDKLVQEKVEIELKECYKMDDMLKENLTTLSDNQILESGGMIYLGAKSNNKDLKLKQFTEIEMINPLSEIMADTNMFLFYGERNKTSDDINWSIDRYSRVPYPIAMLTNGKFCDTVTIDYFANHYRFEKGNMIKILKNRDSLLFAVSLNEFRKVIGFSGGSLGQPGTALYEFIHLFEKNDVPVVNAPSWETSFQFKVLDDLDYHKCFTAYKDYIKDENLQKERQQYFRTYKNNTSFALAEPNASFYIGKIGWINYDRYLVTNGMTFTNTVQLKVSSEESEDVKLILKSKRRPSIIKGIKLSTSSLWVFPNIPVDYEVTINGTLCKNGKIYTASKVLTVKKEEPIHTLDYKLLQ